MDYKNGKIYRIVCNETREQYIGSTCQSLSKRLSFHRSNFKSYINGAKKYLASYIIIERNNYNIILIENYSCNSKEELLRQERYYIEILPNINIIKRPIISIEEKKIEKKEYDINYRLDNQEYRKEQKSNYYFNNKEEIDKKNKKYRLDNKEKIKEYEKKRGLENKEKIKEYKKQYYLKKKEKINE